MYQIHSSDQTSFEKVSARSNVDALVFLTHSLFLKVDRLLIIGLEAIHQALRTEKSCVLTGFIFL